MGKANSKIYYMGLYYFSTFKFLWFYITYKCNCKNFLITTFGVGLAWKPTKNTDIQGFSQSIYLSCPSFLSDIFKANV